MPKYSKDLEWTAPFVDSVRTLVPVDRLLSVRGFIVPFSKNERNQGWCWTLNGKYKISLLSAYQRKGTHTPYTIETILTNLAHELAHLKHFHKHDQKFANLFATILGVFFQNLTRYGIRDIQLRHDTLRKRK